MEEILHAIREREDLRDALLSVLLFALVFSLRRGLVRMVVQLPGGSDRDRVRWSSQVRRATSVSLIVGLIIIWSTELQTMALSFVALGVAGVLATKELIMCASGSFLRASSRSFGVGDRVEIGDVRGDVIDYGLFATTILEIGPGHQWTGRAVTVPNSALLSQPVINETFTQSFVLHVITVPQRRDADLEAARERLLEAGLEASAGYIEEARLSLTEHAAKRGLAEPSVEPRVFLQLPNANEVSLLLRLPAPARDKGLIEQNVLRSFIERTPN